jgi:CXXX repeat peptide maturase
MLQYLIILLDDTSVSYCHYENARTARRPIGMDDLKAGILFAMKQNLTIQFVYPDCELPAEYRAVIESTDHCRIAPSSLQAGAGAEAVVFECADAIPDATDFPCTDSVCVVRLAKSELFRKADKLIALLEKPRRINVALTDADTFDADDFAAYGRVLSRLSDVMTAQYGRGCFPQLNILTDRVLLDRMNNCNAGVENVTLAPNGKFYVCPAFYFEDERDDVGNPVDGLEIANGQLYRIDRAPLCRRCDAYQCRRCVWLNRKTTLEVNTPSREQCVAAHLERNASREWLKKTTDFFPDRNIPEIDYLDPFDAKDKNS